MAGIHMKAIYWRTPTLGVEDVAVTTHDWWNTGTDSTAIADTIAAAYAAFFTANSSRLATQLTLAELRFYFGYDGDFTVGELDYLKSYSLTGADTSGMLPPQCACTVTEILEAGDVDGHSRRHWGRFYLPGMVQQSLTTDGRFTSTFVNGLANAAEILYDDTTTATLWPIVWVHTGSSTWGHAKVTQIRVDDIVDIQRRRRYDSYNVRVTKSIE